jgi:hypothetical protein
MVQYPTSLDPQDFALFLQMVEGHMPAKEKAAHVIYDVAGYALGQLLPDPAMQAATTRTNASLAAITFGPKAMAAGMFDVTSKKIDWGNVLKTLLPILLQLLGQLGGSTGP